MMMMMPPNYVCVCVISPLFSLAILSLARESFFFLSMDLPLQYHVVDTRKANISERRVKAEKSLPKLNQWETSSDEFDENKHKIRKH